MLDALGQFLGTKIDLRDCISFAALPVSVVAFVGKLNADSRTARYRETVAFIEKRESEMRRRWKDINLGNVTGGAFEDELRVFFDQLELVSLLLRQRVFDSELVYNYWWRFFDEPLRNPAINSWVQLHQEEDAAVLEHYIAQCKRWAARLDKERGRPAGTPARRLLSG